MAPDIILQNPFRILGVYANSPKKDIVANKGKATAFLKVGKQVEYPLDLKNILPPVTRTVESFNEAEAHLAVAKEQIKYAQFWFLKITPLDEIAFNHLFAGSIDEAISIWSKKQNVSSLQNKMLCHLIKDSLPETISAASQLYKNFGDSYVEKVDSSCTLRMTSIELRNLFIDSLSKSFGIMKLLDTVTDVEWKTYISSQAIDPIIAKISSEVDKTKKVDHKDPQARMDAARKLISSTKKPFGQLKKLISPSDPQFQMIADKLGLEILQCGIDYYNNSDDDNAAHTAMKIQKYAQSVVIGALAKQRCKENVKILQKIIDELPPIEVTSEDKAIKIELSKFVKLPDKISYAVTLLNKTKPHLQIIKTILGATNVYYLKMSTLIVSNALHNVIEEVNEAQKPLAELSEIIEGMDPMARNILLSNNKDVARHLREINDNVKNTLREAWKATLLMDEFETESDFNIRYSDNRNTLKSLCSNFGVSTSERRVNPTTKTTSTSSTGFSTTSRPSGAYDSSTTNRDSSKPVHTPVSKDNGCLTVIIVYVIGSVVIGGIIAAMGGDFGVGFIIAGIIALCIIGNS